MQNPGGSRNGSSEREGRPPNLGRKQGGGRGQQRKNRPGFNSYLKLELDEPTMNFLHQATVKLRQDFAQQLSTTSNIVDSNDGGSRIRPRSLESLHLTYFFGGEVLCNLSAEELSVWHSSVHALLAQHGFHPETERTKAATIPVRSPSFGDMYWLRVKEFRLFPPRRNYLVVAELEASPALHDLYRELREIAKTSPSKALTEITSASKDEWTPHVTLANIQGRGNRDESQLLMALLQQSQAELLDNGSLPRISPSCIRMGGPIPSVAALNWDFYPRQSSDPETSTENAL